MRQGRHGLKVLGLALVAAISVMAVTAVAAQAANQVVIETKVETAETELEGTGGKGKLLVPALTLELECTTGKIKGKGKNTAGSDFHGTAHILFHGCLVIGNKFCKVYPTAADRTAKTNAGLLLAEGLALIITSGASRYVKASQIGAAPFSTIFLTKAAEGCTLPAENTVTGTAAFKIDTFGTEALEHELLDITPAEETTLGVALKYGENPATLDEGNGSGKLVGAFLGKKFSVN